MNNNLEVYKSTSKVKVVALLDLLLTVVFMAQLIGCAVYPLWVDYSEEVVHAKQFAMLKSASVGGKEGRLVRQVHPTAAAVVQKIGGHDNNNNNNNNGPIGMIDNGWLYAFTGLVTLIGITSVMAIITLLFSASTRINADQARKFASVWMYCDVLTILLAAIEFIFVLATPVFGIQLMPPIPTLLFVGLRAVFFCVVLQELNLMQPTMIPTLDMAMIEANQQRLDMGIKEPLPLPRARAMPIPIVNCQCLTPDSSV